MMTKIPFILLALLCCVMGCTATGLPEFHCMHDEVMKNSGAMPATVVEPGPDKSGVRGAAKTASDPAWRAIRIEVFSEDLNSDSQYCTAEGQMRPTFDGPLQTAACIEMDILTDEKKNQLLTVMIPSALKLHSDRLLVQPVTGIIVVSKYTTGYCGAFTIPRSHQTVGVADADMVMYVAAGPTGGASAWAGPCSLAMDDRPIIGMMNAGPAVISDKRLNIRVAAHEIAHALGFNYDAINALNMVSNIPNIRGQTRKVVTSDVTVIKAKAHYNCDSIAGMELENEGGSGTAGGHWERRNARDELMAGLSGASYYTAITMAFFEDQGYYRANWGNEETMEWGRNIGCPFLEEKCVNNGTTKYPDMFCTEVTSAPVCSFGRKGLGRCKLGKYANSLPVEYQYFADPKLGGTDHFIDFCPIVDQYFNNGCTDGNLGSMPGSRVGPTSVCLKGEGLRVKLYSVNAVQDICADVSCEDNTVRVRYAGDDAWYPCPEGSKITPRGSFAAGKIVCPGHAEICGTDLPSGDNGINKTIDNKIDTQTTTAIPSHDTTAIPSHDTTAIPSHDTTAIPSVDTTAIPFHDTTAIPSVHTTAIPFHDDDSLSKDYSSAHDGRGDASSTTAPSVVESYDEKGSSGAGGVDVRNSSENGGGSASTGTSKTVRPTDSIVDSSQHPNQWYGIFISLSVSFVHLYIYY